MQQTTILIPARYASTRMPGKPLHLLAGKPMLQWVIEAAQQVPNADLIVATDDHKIYALANSLNTKSIMTASDCASGTDRIYAALQTLPTKPSYIINLQGDTPLVNPQLLQQLIANLTDPANLAPVITPAIRLTWDQYDKLVLNKQTNPNSGTLCIKGLNDAALWFSKQIIPNIRNSEKLRTQSLYSPYLQHLGIYGYTFSALEQFVNLPQSYYEKLECLEQLRFLENNIAIKLMIIENEANLWRGVDTFEDANLVAHLLAQKS